MTGTKVSNKITTVSRSSPQNKSETVESETEIPKTIYISPKKEQIIDNSINKINIIIDKINTILFNNVISKNNKLVSFRTKNWVEINDGLHGTYQTNS